VRPQSMIAVVLALVCGGSAAVGVRQIVGTRTTPRQETVPVVVAKNSIPRGMLVSADVTKTRDYPKDLVPVGAILKTDDVVERSAVITMAQDEPILESKLSPKGQRGLASLVSEGMRAFTITTNVASGVAGFILPGNKVDVLLTVSDKGNIPTVSDKGNIPTVSDKRNNDPTGGGITTTLLQNVEILAVDQSVEAPAENKVNSNDLRSVTLLVTPNQAAKLSLGQSSGTLHLMLRNANDGMAVKSRPTTMYDIQLASEPPTRSWDERAKDLLKAWGEAMAKRPAPRPKAAPAVKSIRTIRGGSEGAVIVSSTATSD
jgi:pilus assembly protein CpaB